jgi:hypothetical protein
MALFLFMMILATLIIFIIALLTFALIEVFNVLYKFLLKDYFDSDKYE